MEPEERAGVIATIALVVALLALGGIADQLFAAHDVRKEVIWLRSALPQQGVRIAVLEAASARCETLITSAVDTAEITRLILAESRR